VRHSLGVPVGSAAASAAGSGASPVVIDMTAPGTSPFARAAPTQLVAATAATATLDHARFEREMRAGMTLGDIGQALRERYRGRPAWMARRRRRPLVTLHVTVSGAGNAFGPETYSEVKQVRVDGRIKLLAFHEDYRPPYRGTFRCAPPSLPHASPSPPPARIIPPSSANHRAR